MILKDAMRISSSEVVPLTLEGDLDFFRILLSLQHELTRLSRITQRNFRITTMQKVILQIATRFPGITPSRLAVSLSTPLSTLSGVLSKMKKAKLVKLITDKGDERRVHIYVTSKGQSLLKEADSKVEEALRETITKTSIESFNCTKVYLLELVNSLRGG